MKFLYCLLMVVLMTSCTASYKASNSNEISLKVNANADSKASKQKDKNPIEGAVENYFEDTVSEFDKILKPFLKLFK